MYTDIICSKSLYGYFQEMGGKPILKTKVPPDLKLEEVGTAAIIPNIEPRKL